jgi:hypothetical protein
MAKKRKFSKRDFEMFLGTDSDAHSMEDNISPESDSDTDIDK